MPANGMNTQTDTLVGYGMDKANPGGLIEDNDTIGQSVPKPGAFTTLTGTTVTASTSFSAPSFITSTAISNASTSTTMNAIAPKLVGSSTAAKIYPLSKPTIGAYKYIRCRSGTTSRVTKISVAGASATINNSKTVITLHNTGDSVLLFGETSTRWGIAGSFVAGATGIATS